MTQKNKKSTVVSVEDGQITRILAQAISSYLYAKSGEEEDDIEKEMAAITRDNPEKAAKYDHKDWRWASDMIIYHRGRRDAYDELMEEFARFMARCGVDV